MRPLPFPLLLFLVISFIYRLANRENGQQTFYTVQLYLPSDSSGSDESFKPAQGGSTRFLDYEGGYADVEAIPGRVLIFQHDDLLHTGEEVGLFILLIIQSG